jgi:hypothetical protein
MSKDKLTDHPNEVVVLPAKNRPAKPSVVRSRAAAPSQNDDGAKSIAVESKQPPSSSLTGANPRQSFHGRPPQVEDDVLQVYRILRTALNDKGDTWRSFSAPPRSAPDVDATATDESGAVLRVRVARVERASVKTMARGDPVIRRRSIGQRVTDILVAVDSQARHHSTRERSELLLALDAIRSPEHVERAVVDAFLTAHQTYVAGLGYRAIWLVGPTGEMSHQLC